MFFHRRHNEVRHNPIIFLFFFPILFGFALEEVIFHNSWFALFPVIIFIIVVLIYVKDKMLFDDIGVTFCNIWGRKYHVSWSQILLVEDTIEDPSLSRGPPGRIVKIVYKNKNNKTEMVKYSYTNYVGLMEFLSFYYSQISRQ